MADYIHLTNVIQGEVLRVTERRAPETQQDDLQQLIDFLQDQVVQVTMSRLRLAERAAEG
jgi:uncharacterized protein YajQ (UPF0234 family)